MISLPKEGDAFNKHGWRIEVLDLDGRRVEKVLAKQIAPTRRAGH